MMSRVQSPGLHKSDMEACICHPTTQEAESEASKSKVFLNYMSEFEVSLSYTQVFQS